jgi:pentatricopeptide repeat protein
MLEADRRELDFLFAIVGVRIYSNGRIRNPAKLPTDWKSGAIDPVIRKMMSDKQFADAIEILRSIREKGISPGKEPN